ncbi:MAG: hypothetical protein CL833_14675 [Crocinitomicaceae bacterium]|nr:hypothetical protein [Crocinitomicaceae bacterium]
MENRIANIISRRSYRIGAVTGCLLLFGLLLDYNLFVLEEDAAEVFARPTDSLRLLLWVVLFLCVGLITLIFETILTMRPSKENYIVSIKKSIVNNPGKYSLSSKQFSRLGGDFKSLHILEKFNLGVLVVDDKGIILACNSEFKNKTGYNELDLLGVKATDVLGDHGINEGEKIKARKNKRTELYERTITHKNGSNGRYYTAGIPLSDDQNQPVGSIGVILDITDLANYQRSLEKALAKEVELSDMKSSFITMASHQFRTPLSIIRSNTELISMLSEQTPGSVEDKCAKYINRIQSEISNISNLMDEVLLLEKVSTGKFRQEKNEFDLVDLISKAVESMYLPDDMDGQFSINVSGQTQNLFTHKDLLKKSIINLLSNAHKFSNNKGAEINICYQKDRVRIDVVDEGIGISEEDLNKLFTPFFRSENVTDVPGNGLGLNLVKEYVSQCGGSVEVTSTLGEGTKATIRLENDPYGINEEKYKIENTEDFVDQLVP